MIIPIQLFTRMATNDRACLDVIDIRSVSSVGCRRETVVQDRTGTIVLLFSRGLLVRATLIFVRMLVLPMVTIMLMRFMRFGSGKTDAHVDSVFIRGHCGWFGKGSIDRWVSNRQDSVASTTRWAGRAKATCWRGSLKVGLTMRVGIGEIRILIGRRGEMDRNRTGDVRSIADRRRGEWPLHKGLKISDLLACSSRQACELRWQRRWQLNYTTHGETKKKKIDMAFGIRLLFSFSCLLSIFRQAVICSSIGMIYPFSTVIDDIVPVYRYSSFDRALCHTKTVFPLSPLDCLFSTTSAVHK